MNTNQYIRRYQVAFQRVYRQVNQMIKEYIDADITTDQFQLLQYVGQMKEVTSTEISQHFGVGKSSVTAIVNRLVDKELIMRERNISDRRFFHLRLTERGEAIVEKTEAEINKYINETLEHFDEERTKLFIEDLEKLSYLMEETTKGDL